MNNKNTFSTFFKCLDAAVASDFKLFLQFAFEVVNPGVRYIDNWHIDLICEYLAAVQAGDISRLIINIPPRALKSYIINVCWPAYLLGRDATERIIVASYSSGLSLKHGVDSRNLMSSPFYARVFGGTRLAKDQNEKHKFVTTKRGHRISTSVGGTLTGEGGNVLILDDPINPLQAESNTTREACNKWYEHSFASRLDDRARGAIICIMQRLHKNDLSGFLLERGGWDHLSVPYCSDAKRIYKIGKFKYERSADELLNVKRDTKQIHEQIKSELGSRVYSAQYQQRPVKEDGNMVKLTWFKRYDEIPDAEKFVFQSWDTAIKADAKNDASACVTFVRVGFDYYITDVQNLRLEYPELKKKIYFLAKHHKPASVLIEDKASGQSLLQDLRRETQLPLIAVNPRADKLTRLAQVSALIEAGRVHLPNYVPWLLDFEAQLAEFPNANHDDIVDAFSQGLLWAQARGGDNISIRRV